MEECIFCKIASGDIPTEYVYEGSTVVAFHDNAPKAPVHILFVPRTHITSLADVTGTEDAMMLEMMQAIRDVAIEKGIAETGYKVITRIGRDGGQEVNHLHMHLLGGADVAEIV